MKRWLTLTLAGLLTLSLAGCGSSDGAGSSAPQEINSSSSESSSVQTAEDPWGLTLSVKNVTPTGLTLVITQEGGSPTGTLQYGSDYTLEVEQGGTWQNVPTSWMETLPGMVWPIWSPWTEKRNRPWTGIGSSVPSPPATTA